MGAVSVLCRKVNGIDSGIIDIGFKKTDVANEGRLYILDLSLIDANLRVNYVEEIQQYYNRNYTC